MVTLKKILQESGIWRVGREGKGKIGDVGDLTVSATCEDNGIDMLFKYYRRLIHEYRHVCNNHREQSHIIDLKIIKEIRSCIIVLHLSPIHHLLYDY